MKRKLTRLAILLVILMCSTLLSKAQTVTGKIVSETGEVQPFATVKLKGTQTSITADAQGNYSIKAKPGDVLVFTSASFQSKEMAVKSAVLDVVVKTKVASGTEVVVTGYTARSKRLNTSSISTVDASDVRLQPIASFDQLLQGQATGLNVKTGSGQPGRAADVIIRGRGSITGSVSPLYIVDGIEVRAGDFSTMNQGDFETISVLKDAAAVAIYGSRGANGVIVITTKRGRTDKTVFSYDAQVGFSQLPTGKLEVMNSREKVDYELYQAGNPYGWTAVEADSLRNINTDWRDVLFKTAPMQSHQISASGGTDRTRFYTSISYLNQDGILRNSGLKRYTGRFNLENSYNRVKIGLNFTGGYSEYVGIGEGNTFISNPLNTLLWALPYEVPKTPGGAYTRSVQGIGSWVNPSEELDKNLGYSKQLKALGNLYFEYKLPWLDGLMWKTNVGGDLSQFENFGIIQRGTQRAEIAAGTPGEDGTVSQDYNRQFRATITNALTYKKIINSDHDLSFGLYSEFLRGRGRNFGFTAYGLEQPFRNEGAAVAGTSTNNRIPVIRGGFPLISALMSYFASADYIYKGKYILGLNGRRDASSRLSPDNQVFYSGSVAAGWIVSEENFFPKDGFISQLKLRASYGSAGNQNGIGDFPYLLAYGTGTYGGEGATALSRLGNSNLTWERRRTANIGLDFSVYESRVRGSVEYYNSLTKGLYFVINPPATNNLGLGVLSNSGNMSNRGVELNLGVDIVKSKNFQWTIDANFSYNKNIVEELPENQRNQEYGIANIFAEGKPLNSFFLVKYMGVDPQTGKSLYLKKDGVTITDVYDPADRVIIETSDAPYNGGISNTFRFKNFELGVFWVYSLGNYIYNNARTNIENPGYIASGFARDALRQWQNPGDITDYPGINDEFQVATTRFLETGSFWRLRNVQLGYSLPKKLTDKMKIQGLRFYAQGQNLYTIYKIKALDPEVSSVNGGDGFGQSIEGAQYPALRSITFGANITF
jgi:TonB-linked SusC/RagA family outer membrane protein